MQRYVIDICEQGIEIGALGAVLRHDLGRNEGIVGENAHFQRRAALGDEASDRSETDDADGLAGEFDAGIARGLPLSLSDAAVRLRQIAAQRQQMRDGQFRRGGGVGVGRIEHHDPALGGGRNVDIVDTDPGPADSAQPRCGLDHGLRDARLGANDQRIVLRDAGNKGVFVKSGLQVGLYSCVLVEEVTACGVDGIGDQDGIKSSHAVSLRWIRRVGFCCGARSAVSAIAG